jgi:hypothetical protein
MKELYNFFDFGYPSMQTEIWILLSIFALFFIAGIMKLINMLFVSNKKTSAFSFISIVSVIAIPIILSVSIACINNNVLKLYQNCVQIYNEGNYLTEEGTVKFFGYSEIRDTDEYYITFMINGVIFEEESFEFFGDVTFSRNEVEQIKNANKCKVEYIKNNGNIIVLRLEITDTNTGDAENTGDGYRENQQCVKMKERHNKKDSKRAN